MGSMKLPECVMLLRIIVIAGGMIPVLIVFPSFATVPTKQGGVSEATEVIPFGLGKFPVIVFHTVSPLISRMLSSGMQRYPSA